MLRTGCANDHGVTKFALQLAVMRHPAESHLSECQIVLLADRAKYFQGLEVGVVPLTPPVRLALPVLGVKAQASSITVRSVLSGKESSTD